MSATRSLPTALSLICLPFLPLSATPARAALVLNDVRPWTGSTGVFDIYPSQATLYNSGPSAASLAGCELRAVGDTSFTVALPAAWSVPAGAYVVVNFGAGGSDDVFDDDSTAIYSVDPGATLVSTAGEIGLYQNGIQLDFVNWGADSTSLGSAYFDAVTQAPAGWTPGAFVSIDGASTVAHLQRVPSGYDTNVPDDWQLATFSYFLPPVLHSHNDLQVGPVNGALLDAQTADFSWRAVHDAFAYRLQVARDSTFDSLVVDATVPGTTYPGVALPASALCFWRVIPDLPGGPFPASVWQCTTSGTAASGPVLHAAPPAPQAAVPQLYQHKDTPLLCDWNLILQRAGGTLARNTLRPACRESVTTNTQTGPWDAAHPVTDAHIRACGHCNMYCVRASYQMVNQLYRGTLTQDEISHRLWRVANPGPEGDLGHGMGGNVDSMLSVLRWAMSDNAGITGGAPVIATIRTEILAGRPVIACILSRQARWTPVNTESHCIVFDGYEERVIQVPVITGRTPQGRPIWGTQNVTKTWLHLVDPIPGGTNWYDLSDLRGPLAFYLNANVVGRAGSTRIRNNANWVDTDGDGLVDFDEGLTNAGMDSTRRPYECKASVADTDGDGLGDKQEIRSYTFHILDHARHPAAPPAPGQHPNITQRLTFADVDGDGKRAERDTDTDNDGRDDGVEDCNRNGKSPEAPPVPACRAGGETCVFDPLDPLNRFGPPPRGLKCISIYPRSPREDGVPLPASGAPLLDGGTTTFSLPVDEHWTILDLDVDLTITHPRDQDLVVRLVSPLGEIVALTTGNGGSGQNYTGTVFDDEADEAITDGFAPFAGPYRPESPLWMLEGEDAYGVWLLQVTDTTPGEAGTLDSLCLSIQHDDPAGTAAQGGGGGGATGGIPQTLALSLMTNPARSQARVMLALPVSGDTRVEIFDIAGRRIATLAEGWMSAGIHRLRWNGTDAHGREVGGGVYFVRVENAGAVRVERLTLAR